MNYTEKLPSIACSEESEEGNRRGENRKMDRSYRGDEVSPLCRLSPDIEAR